MSHLRYHLSRILPMPMISTYVQTVDGDQVEAGEAGNHFRTDTHHDLVSTRWVQWRGRCMRKRTTTVCVGA